MENKSTGSSTPMGAREQMIETHNRVIETLKSRKIELLTLVKEQREALRDTCHDLFGTLNFDEKYLTRKRNNNIFLMLILIVVATIEWPINRTGLLPLGLSNQGTNIIAAVFGIACSMLAWLSGHFLKRGQVEGNRTKIWFAILLTVAALIIFFVFANIRVQYLQGMGKHITVGKTMWTILSFAIYFVGFAASYRLESDVENTNQEKAYKTDMRKYLNTKKEIVRIDKKISYLEDKHGKNISKRAEEDEKVARKKSDRLDQEERFYRRQTERGAQNNTSVN